jgi:hypothetical protein
VFKCTCYVIGTVLIAGAAHAQSYNPYQFNPQQPQAQPQIGGYSNPNPSVRTPPSMYYQPQMPGSPNYLPPQQPGYQYAPGYPPGYRPQM